MSARRERYRSWGIAASGVLPDGTLALVIEVRFGKQRWSWDAKALTVVICNSHGMFRMRTNGSTNRLGPELHWPTSLKSSNRRQLQNLLAPHMPSLWGHSKDMLSVSIPARVLQSNSANLPRLLLSWFNVSDALSKLKCDGSERLLTDTALPHPCDRNVKVTYPLAITTIPNTHVVIEAIDTGILLERLELGLERIYISEMSWVRSPRIQAPLFAMEKRFAGRLVLVKAQAFNRIAEILKVRRWTAAEYQFIGDQLAKRYQDDFGYDKYENPKALAVMYRYRIGVVPRGHAMLWMRELDVPLCEWAKFDIDAMKAREAKNDRANKTSEQRALKAISYLIKQNEPAE